MSRSKKVALSKVVKKATKRPLLVVTGKNVCFHAGNRVSITKIDKPPGGEVTESTVAEVWPATDGVDICDAALIAHSYNNFEAVVNALKEAQEELKRLQIVHRDKPYNGQPEPELIARNKRVLQRAYVVHFPIEV